MRAVEIQAARVVAVADAEGDDADVGERGGGEAERFAAARGVEVGRDGERAFAEEREAAGAGGALGGVHVFIEAERADAHDQEAATREHRDGGEAAAATARGAAQAHAREREAGGGHGAFEAGEEGRCEGERGDQQQRARAEEEAGGGSLRRRECVANKAESKGEAGETEECGAHAARSRRREEAVPGVVGAVRLLTSAATRFFPAAAGEEFAGGALDLFAQGEPERENRDEDAADDAAGKRRRLGVEMQVARADGVAPHGRKRVQHGARIPDRARRAEQRAEQRQPRAFAEQEASHLRRREAEREQRADFLRALFDAKLEEQRHQHARRDDQEKAEADEQPAEVLSLRTGRQRLRPHGLEGQAEVRGLELGEQSGFQFQI